MPSPSALAFSLPAFWPKAEAVAAADTLTASLGTAATPVLRAAVNTDPNPSKGGTDLSVVAGGALLPESGPEGTSADISTASTSTQISIYVVRQGDSLASIAKLFGVSKNTILWANDLKSAGGITPGMTLVILPVSGVEHVVTKGETLASIVKKFKGDIADVLAFNNLSAGDTVAIGDTIIIPDGIDGPAPSISSPGTKKGGTSGSSGSGSAGSYERLLPGYGGPSLPGYFIRPLAGGIKTQGLHGYNAVDIGVPSGTSVKAAAEGTVVVARSGYNGGYGNMIAISHPNGTQTVYGHLSGIYATPGSHVEQGQIIGLSGNSGRSTGPHLHFEIRGATNPF